MALANLAQCLVSAWSDEIDEGTYQHDSHPMVDRQNLWRAQRHGLDAMLIDSSDFKPQPVREMLLRFIDQLSGTADRDWCRRGPRSCASAGWGTHMGGDASLQRSNESAMRGRRSGR